MLLKILLVITYINFVQNCEESQSDVTDTSYVSAEYQNIFKAIPALFEYVLDIIEEKPEILEKDDVTVFTEDVYENVAAGDDTRHFVGDVNDEKSIQVDDVWDWYPGVTEGNSFNLSPTEVAEKTLEVERQLEEYNKRRT